MPRAERVLIATFLLVAGPFSFFIAGWWGSATLGMTGLVPMSESGIAVSALAGLAIGLVVVLLRLKPWLAGFYNVPIFLAALVYLFWSAVATGLFMGLPVGVLVLGTLAGLYVGRRARHIDLGKVTVLEKGSRRAGLFTAAVVGFVSIAMGALAVGDAHTMQAILSLVGLDSLAESVAGRIALVAVAVSALIAAQYWLTRGTARLAFSLAAA